jgi:hypothetical protein
MASIEAKPLPELSAKQSVEAAKQFAQEVLSDKEFLHPRLEAVELSNDHDYWLVTISYLVADEDPEDLAREMVEDYAHYHGVRQYKTLYVRTSDGKVLRMTPAGRL